ncbi:MAG: glycosyltransferase [Clostridiales Family XIII bacterium]|jgi:glycosyltransferase involved in cell wall biosynthesis|nr:glycosyltransferase [Clostridiales Family XIII bacterium]
MTDAVKTVAAYYHRLNNGGAEKVMANLANIWIASGYRVILFTDDEPSDDDYFINKNAVRIILPKYTPEISHKDRADALVKAIETYDIDIYINHAWENPYVMKDVNIMKKHGIPVSVYAHGSFAYMLSWPSATYFTMPEILGSYDGIICLSRVDQLYWSTYCKYVKKVINPISVEVNRTNNFARDSSEIQLIWVGRLEFRKGYLDLISVMEQVIQRYPNAILHIVGAINENDYNLSFEKSIVEKNLQNNIILEGYHKDISAYYQSSDIFVMTSVAEGFCLGLLESKAYSLPAVVYDLPNLEMHIENKGMIKVEPYDTRSMADAICSLIENDSLRGRLSEEAYKSYSEYENINQGEIWDKIFNDIIKGNDTPSIPDERQIRKNMLDTLRFYMKMGADNLKSNYIQTVNQQHSEITRLSGEVSRLTDNVEWYRNSTSYRIGRKITRFPGMIKHFVKR